MSTISLCMIVKNEELTLARCLNSCKKLFDEIIIVDTGSHDKTKQIARKYTNQIYDFKWQNDFSLARNYAFSKATSEYIMWLDADDVVPKNSLKELLKLKPLLNADVYMLKYNIAFCNNKPTFSYYRERIVKNCAKALWQGVVHECITPFGEIKRLSIAINHKKIKYEKSDRNIKIYRQLIKKRPLTPREQYYYGRELYDHKKYYKSISVLKKFVLSGKGWHENVCDAIYIISECYRQINATKKQLAWLLKSFEFAVPRANIACKIADNFLCAKNYNLAIFWYNLATKCEDVTLLGGFVEPMYYNYYPYLQMCYCYFCLGDLSTSEKYNNLAKKYYKSEQVINNEKYFNSLKTKNSVANATQMKNENW